MSILLNYSRLSQNGDCLKFCPSTALGKTGIEDYTVDVSPVTYPNVGQWEPVTVTVSVDFDDVSWIPLPEALRGIFIEGSSTLPRETSNLSPTGDWLGDIKK